MSVEFTMRLSGGMLAVAVMDVVCWLNVSCACTKPSQSGDRDGQCSKKQVPHEFKL